MLCGLTGTFVSILWFGLADSYWGCVASRFAWGFLNGNIGVAKAYLADVCDEKSMAKGFSALGMAGGMGRLVGPAVGAYMVHPADKYPMFVGTIFQSRPFLLPCVGGAVVQGLAWIMTWLYLKEASHLGSEAHAAADAAAAAKLEGEEAGKPEAESLIESAKGVVDAAATTLAVEDDNWWAILTSRHVTVASALYWVFAIPGIITIEALPLWALTPPDLGGFCFQPQQIGNLMVTHAVLILTIQAFCYSKLTDMFGFTKVYRYCVLSMALSCCVLPFISGLPGPGRTGATASACDVDGLAADSGSDGISRISWLQIVLVAGVTSWQVVSRIIGLTTSFVLINNSCVSRHRGLVNGGAQTLVAAARMVAPVMGGALFQWSVSRDASGNAKHAWPFNHHFIWYMCAVMSVISWGVALQLPPDSDRKKPG